MKMTATQSGHVLKRVNEIVQESRHALSKKHTTLGLSLTEEQRLELVKSHKVKVHSHFVGLSRRDDIGDVFDFSKYEREDVLDEEKYDIELAVLIKESNIVRDMAVLGDGDTAIKLLNAFEKKFA